MNPLLEIGLHNAIVAGALAVVAYCISRIWRNPVATHALWTLVLLKLLIPPVWSPTIHVGRLSQARSVEETVQGARILPSDAKSSLPPVDRSTRDQERAPVEDSDHTTTEGLWARNQSLLDGVSIAWLFGSVVCAGVVVRRTFRFHGLLRVAEPAPLNLEKTVQEVAALLRLRQAPKVKVVAAPITPLVWPVGLRSLLVVPSRYIRDLSARELRTVLAHELAHLRRRDHWGRWVQTLATILYWWHPAVWLGRRELRRTEEVCCDIVVLQTLPDAARDYVEALIRSVNLVSAQSPRPSALALGFHNQGCLKRRIEMMLKHAESARLSNKATCALLVGGFLVLTAGVRVLALDDPVKLGKGPTGSTDQPAAVPAPGRRALSLAEKKLAAARVTQRYERAKTLDDAIKICQKQLQEAGKSEYAGLLTENRVKKAITTAIASYETGMSKEIQSNDVAGDQARKSFEFFTRRVKPELELIRDQGIWKNGWCFNPISGLTDARQVSYEGLLLRMEVETPGDVFDGFGLPIVDVLYGHFK